MSIYTGIITIEDAKNKMASFRVYMDPTDINSDPVSFETCLTVLANIAHQLVSDSLIAGRIVDLKLVVSYDVSLLANNPTLPETEADVEEKLKLSMRTESGILKTWYIPTVDDDTLINGDIHYDLWEDFIALMDNNGLGLVGQPHMCDRRGDRIAIGSLEETSKHFGTS